MVGQESLEARLTTVAQAAIRQLLSEKGEQQTLSLTEMEALVGRVELRLRQDLMQALVEDAPRPRLSECPQCGGAVRYKGVKAKQVVTVRGEVRVERDYYYCRACQAGFFPPRPDVGRE
jgi:uncharacterized protein with PIN domain